MKQAKILGILLLVVLLISIASASMIIPASDRAREVANAPEHSPVITDIGGLWGIERIDFIHYAKPENPAKPGGTNTCYKLMGVKWPTLPVSYVVNPLNPGSLSEEFVMNSITTSTQTWDAATSSQLFSLSPAINYTAQYGVFDSKNSIVFGPYADNNAIAVTSVWYTRVGKRIVEFDIIFNTYYNWGDATIAPNVMDLQNIATHELGHSVGLSDIYASTCSAVTMYGYSWNGDIEKRTLEQADITGLQRMYGI